MNGQEEFFKVNIAVIVLVEVPEDIVTELLRVGRHEAGAVHVHEGLRRQPAVGAVLLEAPVPGHDGVDAVVGVLQQVVQIIPGQTSPLAGFCPHDLLWLTSLRRPRTFPSDEEFETKQQRGNSDDNPGFFR